MQPGKIVPHASLLWCGEIRQSWRRAIEDPWLGPPTGHDDAYPPSHASFFASLLFKIASRNGIENIDSPSQRPCNHMVLLLISTGSLFSPSLTHPRPPVEEL